MRNKFYSFINTFGLAFGMAITILIALYVQHELSFDRYHKNADRIYRVAFTNPKQHKFAVTHAPLAPVQLHHLLIYLDLTIYSWKKS